MRALPAGAMARHAIVAERGLAFRHGELQQVGIVLDIRQRSLGQRLFLPGTGRLQGRDVGGDFIALRMIEQAMRVAVKRRPGRHHDPVADRPDDAGVEDASHQRGSGVFSSLMPSHSWPVVSVPECRRSFSLADIRRHSSSRGMRAASSNFGRFFGHQA